MKESIAHLTDEAIKTAFLGTNFGRTDYDVILADTVLKYAAGYCAGGTATAIAIRLGLLSGKTEKPTKAGHEWALEVFYSRRNSGPNSKARLAMKTNRQARRLFGAFGKISNTRRITLRVLNDHWTHWRAISIDQIKPTRSQKRRKRRVAAIVAWAEGQHTQGERD